MALRAFTITAQHFISNHDYYDVNDVALCHNVLVRPRATTLHAFPIIFSGGLLVSGDTTVHNIHRIVIA